MSQAAQELHEALNLAGDAVERDAAGNATIIASECADCQKRVFPPTDVCPECLSENLTRLPLSRRGTLYSWSVVHAAPKGWSLPFIAAYVDLPDGVRVFAHMVDIDPADLVMDLGMVDPLDVVFDGVLGGEDLVVRPVELVQGGVERCCSRVTREGWVRSACE